jgi:hypothetical protein
MNSIQRMMPRLAGAAGVAAALWIVSPASGAEINASAKQSGGVVGTKTASRHHHRWPQYHFASWYTSHVHYADAGISARQCNWFCGRPFVLMVGVAY